MTFLDPTPPSFMTATPGSYPQDATTFASLTHFVAARRARIDSRERDFGLVWRDGSDVYRAAWIFDTGELYIVQLGDPDEGGGHVELLATGTNLDQTRRALYGWRTTCGHEGSLGWLRERAARHLPAPVPAPVARRAPVLR